MKPEKIAALLRKHRLIGAEDMEVQACAGGDIHQSFAVRSAPASMAQWFIKLNSLAQTAVLAGEYQSLVRLGEFAELPYPRPLDYDTNDDFAYLIMQYHDLGSMHDAAWRDLGTVLAGQHRIQHENFGWFSDNHIGLTPQRNDWAEQWPTFYAQQRLGEQVGLAIDRGLSESLQADCQAVIQRIDHWFQAYAPVPSLLHGDLWSGNVALDRQRNGPLLYDPAPYFGDREADIAMTELFGRFPPQFYAAYQQTWPLDPGYEQRRDLYNLYHALNHFNLFGATYESMVARFLSLLNVER